MLAPSPVAASLATLCAASAIAALRSGQGYLSQGHLSSPGGDRELAQLSFSAFTVGFLGVGIVQRPGWGGQSGRASSQSALPVFKSQSLSPHGPAGREAGSDGSHLGQQNHRPGVDGQRGQLSQSSSLGWRGQGQRRGYLTPFVTPATVSVLNRWRGQGLRQTLTQKRKWN